MARTSPVSFPLGDQAAPRLAALAGRGGANGLPPLTAGNAGDVALQAPAARRKQPGETQILYWGCSTNFLIWRCAGYGSKRADNKS